MMSRIFAALFAGPMLKNGSWRVFLTGLLCGATLIATAWAGSSVWWKSRIERSPENAALYDACLAQNAGNTVACEAFMRTYDRFKTRDAALKEEAANFLAAGSNKRDVFNWAMKNDLGFKGSLEAAGISEKDYHDNNF